MPRSANTVRATKMSSRSTTSKRRKAHASKRYGSTSGYSVRTVNAPKKTW